MLGKEITTEYARLLASGDPRDRREALFDLEELSCAEKVAPAEKKLIGAVLIANFHLRPVIERRIIARFLDVWFVSETSRRLSRRIEVTRLEEIDPEARESLRVAAVSTMPAADLIKALEYPSREDLDGGLGLLIVLETIASRLYQGTIPHRFFPALVHALRAARAHRASHIAKPFLWRLETVMEMVARRASYLFQS